MGSYCFQQKTDTCLAEESNIPLNPRQQVEVRPGMKRKPMTALNSQKEKSSSRNRVLITVLMVLVVLGILATAGYFIAQLINSKYFFCSRSVKFISLDKACDGMVDCSGGEDELTCVASMTVNTTFPGKHAHTHTHTPLHLYIFIHLSLSLLY
ncbi:unnamed protein product, partial [Oncorhynchus mykiss]